MSSPLSRNRIPNFVRVAGGAPALATAGARRRQYVKIGRRGTGARVHIPMRIGLASVKAPARRG
ncbi:hypothetical protein BLAT2472_40329 [Burkholderia latens]